MTSKIIQISAASSDKGTYVYALCEDGTIWRKYGESGNWKSISLNSSDDKKKKAGVRRVNTF